MMSCLFLFYHIYVCMRARIYNLKINMVLSVHITIYHVYFYNPSPLLTPKTPQTNNAMQCNLEDISLCMRLCNIRMLFHVSNLQCINNISLKLGDLHSEIKKQ